MITMRHITATVATLCLAGSLMPAAQATPAGVTRLIITCPTAAAITDIIGESTILAPISPKPDCTYMVGTEALDFTVWDAPLDEARTAFEAAQRDATAEQPVTDVSGWGAGAFQYERGGSWHVTYPLQEVSATLGVPDRFKDDAVALAQLFAAATSPRPVPTVAPQPFTATCPSAADVGKIVGYTMLLAPADEPNICHFRGKDSLGRDDVEYFIDETFGSVTEARTSVELDLKNTNIRVNDFPGLSEGAFVWTDAGPSFLTWQLQDGVVARMVGGNGENQERRLALLFEEAQTTSGGTPSTAPPTTPGLPTTGD